MKRNESLISGPIGSALLAFVVPLMLSSLVQQRYVTADAVIVGRIAGKTALAAIDSVHTLFRFPINFMNGLAAGATILISRHFGAENRDGLRSCMLSAGALAVVLGILCAVGGVLLTPVLLQTCRASMITSGSDITHTSQRRNGFQQTSCIGIGRRLENGVPVPRLLDAPMAHHQNTV